MKSAILTMLLSFITIGTVMLWLSMNAQASQFLSQPLRSQTDSQVNTQTLILHAARSVEEAWEAFHRAAIGGTLASPDSQFRIERQLHQARILLLDSKKAERRHDRQAVAIIIRELNSLTHEIVTASQERKP